MKIILVSILVVLLSTLNSFAACTKTVDVDIGETGKPEIKIQLIWKS